MISNGRVTESGQQESQRLRLHSGPPIPRPHGDHDQLVEFTTVRSRVPALRTGIDLDAQAIAHHEGGAGTVPDM